MDVGSKAWPLATGVDTVGCYSALSLSLQLSQFHNIWFWIKDKGPAPLVGKFQPHWLKPSNVIGGIREAPTEMLALLFGHCPFGGRGLDPCQDGLGHLFREELSKFKWAFA